MRSKTIQRSKKSKIKLPNKSKTFLKAVDSSKLQSLLKEHLNLLSWYRVHKRPLPWRTPKPNPYFVWISEIMLQQSTMQTVLPYFERWIQRFPRVEDLAVAEENELLKFWQGLGYYQRVRNLKVASIQILNFINQNHRWPQSYDEWKNFKGVGDYTAAAVSAISFNRPVLPVDGNVIRVLSRFWSISNPLNKSQDLLLIKNIFQKFSEKIPEGLHAELAQAFMELGALLCRPKNEARCELCPISKNCSALKLNLQNELPSPKIKSPSIKILSLSLIYRGKDQSPILRQIPEGRRLAGQWELPQYEIESADPQSLIARYQRVFECFGPLKHSITKHRYWAWGLNLGDWGHSKALPHGHKQLSDLGPHETISTLSRKILFKVEKSGV